MLWMSESLLYILCYFLLIDDLDSGSAIDQVRDWSCLSNSVAGNSANTVKVHCFHNFAAAVMDVISAELPGVASNGS